MTVKSAQSLTVDFEVKNPGTRALVNADALPVGTLIINGVNNAAVVTVTNKATGWYKAAVACPTLAAGDVVQIWAAFAVGTVPCGGIIFTDMADTSLVSDAVAAIATRATLGSGAVEWTYTVTSSVDGTPIDGCAVWVTTDAAGTNVIASGVTNASGVVTFWLDAGTYYIWRSLSQWDFDNPDLEVVAA